MNKKRNILIVIPSLNGGGLERVLVNILKAVDYSKYRIDLCVVLKQGVYLKEIPDNVNVIHLFDSFFFLRLLIYMQKKFNNTEIFKRVIGSKVAIHYDIAISYSDSNYTDLLYLLPNVGKKVSWSHASYGSNKDYSKYYKSEKYKKLIKAQRYDGLDVMVFVSNDSMKEFVSIFGFFKDMRVIYNYIDIAGIIRKANECFVRKADVVEFIAIGRLTPVKGYDRLIRVAKRLKNNNYRFRVKILGDGPLKNLLLRQVIDSRLTQYIEFCGFKINPYPLIKSADVFIMTSISEALPTALCEAFVLGKPVIVTNCSGCRELVDNGKYGLLVEQDDDSLYEGMISFIEDEEKRAYYEKMSIERSAIFDDDIVMEKYCQIFDL